MMKDLSSSEEECKFLAYYDFTKKQRKYSPGKKIIELSEADESEERLSNF